MNNPATFADERLQILRPDKPGFKWFDVTSANYTTFGAEAQRAFHVFEGRTFLRAGVQAFYDTIPPIQAKESEILQFFVEPSGWQRGA